KCTGCESCVNACIEHNNLNEYNAELARANSKDGLSADKFLSINKNNDGKYIRKSCMHCIDPACVSACLVGGLQKLEEGPVIYNPDKCIGCRYCMLSCPFNIPRYEWTETDPYVQKCQMCYEQLLQGKTPECVEACPNGAIIFGERNALLKAAYKKISSSPNYLKHVWGEHELGGTYVLYISDVNLSGEGWPVDAAFNIPGLTEPLIESTPIIGLGVGTVLIGLNWIIGRRKKIASEENKEDSHAK
ncbi:MAG: 4Fe-4S dicluster domain-containing protein, partial [Bacteroidota bacterium]